MSETVDMTRFESLGVIVGKKIPERKKIDYLFKELNDIFAKKITTKEEIVRVLSRYMPDFEHMEKGKSLDGKM